MNFVEALDDAKKQVASSPLFKKYIAGTPLENDIAVWIAEAAVQAARHPKPVDVQIDEDGAHWVKCETPKGRGYWSKVPEPIATPQPKQVTEDAKRIKTALETAKLFVLKHPDDIMAVPVIRVIDEAYTLLLAGGQHVK